VAQDLLNIEKGERWHLIAGVWSEMLFYAAPRCGAAFHYKHLSTGGELATHVLLLMKFLGPFLRPEPYLVDLRFIQLRDLLLVVRRAASRGCTVG
jgi:hypothetical protein